MGLDITVLVDPKLVTAGAPDPNSNYRGYWVYKHPSFPKQFEGFEEGVYEGETWGFRAGSYSGYNEFRQYLSLVGMNAAPETVWGDTKKYLKKPFFEQVNFSDCEGSIGPVVARKLAKDYADNRESFVKFIEMKFKDTTDREYFINKYDEWSMAFSEAGATNGAVLFH